MKVLMAVSLGALVLSPFLAYMVCNYSRDCHKIATLWCAFTVFATASVILLVGCCGCDLCYPQPVGSVPMDGQVDALPVALPNKEAVVPETTANPLTGEGRVAVAK